MVRGGAKKLLRSLQPNGNYNLTKLGKSFFKAIALASYYDSAQVDALITGAAISNAPAWGGNTTWELLTGQALRNLHFTGPLVATLQNSGNTLQIECQAYDQSQTYTQAEVNAQISSAVDALNVSQYATQADIDSSIASELTNYWDQGETSAEIASQISSSGLLTEAQGDARYHPVNGNAGGGGIIPMVLDNFTPRMIRALLPHTLGGEPDPGQLRHGAAHV